MKIRILAGALLLALGSTANAATVYVLDSVTYINTFFSPPVPVAACNGCGTATAIEDGGAVTLSTAGWEVSGSGIHFEIAFSGTTSVGSGVSLTKDPGHTCTDFAGAACDPIASNLSGYGGDVFYTGLGFDGTTACAFCEVNTSISGNTLTVEIRRQLTEAGIFNAWQAINMNYQVVPVPAAVWLFGSALGLLAFRRRQAA